MTLIRHCLYLTVAACLLAGCATSSDTGALFLLEQGNAPGITPSNQSQGQLQPILALAQVKLARYLTRGGIVYQTGPNRIIVAGNNHWAAPLQNQLTDGLYSVLDRELTDTDVRHPEVTSLAQSDFKLVAHIQQFQGRYDGTAIISGSWRLFNSKGAVVGRGDFTQTTPLQHDGYAALVRALSRGWGAVKQSMAKAVGQALNNGAGKPATHNG